MNTNVCCFCLSLCLASVILSAAPAVHAEPELPGLWLGHGTCEGLPATFTLSVRTVPTEPSTFEADAGGWLPPLRLTGALDAEDKYVFKAKEWIDPDRPGKTPYNLEFRWLEEPAVLYGNKIDPQGSCRGLILRRIQVVREPENPDGILSQVSQTANLATARMETVKGVEVEACATWAKWLVDRDKSYADSRQYPPLVVQPGLVKLLNGLHPALQDLDGMRRVFGKDFHQWTDADARDLKLLEGACVEKLKKSLDLSVAALHAEVTATLSFGSSSRSRLWPLDTKSWKMKFPKLLEAAYADDITRLRLVKRQIDAGLTSLPLDDRPESIGERRERLAGTSIHELTGEWFGYIQCAGAGLNPVGISYPMRAFIEESSGHVTGQLDVSGLFWGSGVVKGTFDAAENRVDLAVPTWTEARAGALQINGSIDPQNGTLTADLVGPTFKNCPRVQLSKALRTPLGKNGDGLLFAIMSEGHGSFLKDVLTAEDCERYARWLARHEVKNIGHHYFFYGLFDREDMRNILGKDLYQWETHDANDLSHLAKTCQAYVTAQPNQESIQLAQHITRYGWLPSPLDRAPYNRDGTPNRAWLEIEKLIDEISGSRDRVAAQLVDLQASPATLPTLNTVNGFIDEISGWTRLSAVLSEPEKQELLTQYQAEHDRIASGIVDEALTRLADQMTTLQDLQAGRRTTESLQESLRQALAPNHAANLGSRFTALAAEKAVPLWEQHLVTSNQAVQALADSGFEDADRLLELDHTSEALAEFLEPGGAPGLSDTYEAFRSARTARVEKLLQQSAPDLIAWITAMPPSLGARQAIERFQGHLHTLGAGLATVTGVRAAITDKLAAYNPDHYRRADIVMSLVREHWVEVSIHDLDDLSYLYTAFRSARGQCQSTLDAYSIPLTSFTSRLANSATQRILNGGITSRSEAARAFFLVANNIVNQPGCKVNYLGTVVGCTTQADHAAAQDFIMTSSAGAHDAGLLLHEGCNSDLRVFVEALVRYASGHFDFRPARPMDLPDFFAYMDTPY